MDWRTSWNDDEDVTVIGEHEVLAELRRRAARPLAPPAPTLPPPVAPVAPVATLAPARRPTAMQFDDDGDDWWDDEDTGRSGLTRGAVALVVVLAIGVLGLVGLRSCGDDQPPAEPSAQSIHPYGLRTQTPSPSGSQALAQPDRGRPDGAGWTIERIPSVTHRDIDVARG